MPQVIPPWMQRAFDRCASCALDSQADRERLAAALLDEQERDRVDPAYEELARQVDALKRRYHGLGMQNVYGKSTAEQAKLRARYKLAEAEYFAAQHRLDAMAESIIRRSR